MLPVIRAIYVRSWHKAHAPIALSDVCLEAKADIANAPRCPFPTQSGHWPHVTKGIAPKPQSDIVLTAGNGPHYGGKPWSGENS